MDPSASPNDEAIDLWNTTLFDKFQRFQWLLTEGLGVHGTRMLELLPARPGERVLDIGCGFGDMSAQLADQVGPSGEVVGVDAAQRFVETSATLNEGREQLRFVCSDAETSQLGEGFDIVASRFGTMFFASPVAALRNMQRSLKPGGRLQMVVWRRREDNPWLYLAETCVDRVLGPAEKLEGPSCGPGPFSMAGPDMVSDQLLAAGFVAPRFDRVDARLCIGRDPDEAIEFALALGPAGERLRLGGEAARAREPELRAALAETFRSHLVDGQVWAAASTWVVSAHRPS